MKIANQQKLVVGIAALAVLILVITTVWSRPTFLYKQDDSVRKANNEAHQQSIAEYQKYLAEAKIDPVASEQILSNVIDKASLASEIRSELGDGKPTPVPTIDESRLRITDANDQASVERYVNSAAVQLSTYYKEADSRWGSAFVRSPDKNTAATVYANSQTAVQGLYALEVPRVALGMHKALIRGVVLQQNAAGSLDKVARGAAVEGEQWGQTIPTYNGSRQQIYEVNTAVKALASKYGDFAIHWGENEGALQQFGFIKVAHANVPVSVITDLPRILAQLLAALNNTIVINYIKDKITSYYEKLDQNLLISNFIHYTDAQINSKYANTFLAKYVADPQDQDMIKRFLPQFNCGRKNESDLRRELRARAIQYLGFDPAIPLDQSSPDFWKTLAKTGDLRSNEYGYRLFYESLAMATEGVANQAAVQEQLAPGKKVPIDPKDNKITQSLDSIRAQVNAALNALFNLAPQNASQEIPGLGNFIVNTTFAVLSRLQIKGGVTLAEQKTCIKVPVLNPIVPGDFTPSGAQPTDTLLNQCMADPASCENLIFAAAGGGSGVLPRGTPTSGGGRLAPPPTLGN